jgi:hypothetical protein
MITKSTSAVWTRCTASLPFFRLHYLVTHTGQNFPQEVADSRLIIDYHDDTRRAG